MSLGFGNLARIGQLYPSGGLVDYEPQLMAPAGVQFLTTRLPFRSASLESDRRLADALEEHVQLLADAQVDLIVFNCTAASLVIGPQIINARIHAATGIRSITTIEAVLAALAAVGAKRIALVTPYMAEVVAEEVHFPDARRIHRGGGEGPAVHESDPARRARSARLDRDRRQS